MYHVYKGIDASETKAVVAVLTFIIKNAAKYNVSDDVLSNELTQLGLPKGMANSF